MSGSMRVRASQMRFSAGLVLLTLIVPALPSRAGEPQQPPMLEIPATMRALAAPVVDTEAEKVLREAKAPARFADYKPRFTLRQRAYMDKDVPARTVEIVDRERVVASFDSSWAGGVGRGQIHILDMHPTRPWNDGAKEGGRSIRNNRITLVPWGWCGAPQKHEYGVETDGTTVWMLNRTVHSAPSSSVLNVCAWRVDPVCGYVLDMYWELQGTPPDFTKTDADRVKTQQDRFANWGLNCEYSNIMPNFTAPYITKPTFDWRYEWLIFTPVESDLLLGAYNDTPISNAYVKFRPFRSGGFLAFCKDPDGWSQLMSRRGTKGVNFTASTCWKLLDQHNLLAIKQPDADGVYRGKVWARMMNFPPEGTKYLLRSFELNNCPRLINLPLGGAQGFESADGTGRGPPPWKGLETTDREARSGKRCATFAGGTSAKVSLQPLPVLEAGTAYRIEAWLKVRGPGATARLMVEPSRWTPPAAKEPKLQMLGSNDLPSSDAWQRIAVEFTTPAAHGRSPWLYLEVKVPQGAQLYLDDVAVQKAATR